MTSLPPRLSRSPLSPSRLLGWALLVPLVYVPAVVLGERPPLAGLVALAVASALALGAAFAYARTAALDRLASAVDRAAPALVSAAVMTYAIAAYSLSRAAVRQFDPGMSQLGLFTQSSWTALHGYPFSNTRESIDGSLVSHFAIHFSPTLLLFQPMMKLWPSALTLSAGQAVLTALSIVPLFVLLRRRTTSGAAALLAIGYFGIPAIALAGHHDFHDADLLPVFLFSAFAALDARRRGLFTVFALLALGIREDTALTLALLGVYMLIARRDVVGGMWAAGLGLGWGVVVTRLVMPAFWTPGLWIDPARFLALHLGHLGTTPGAIVSHVAHDPLEFAQLVVNHDNMKYLYTLLRPTLVVPLLGGLAWVPALPALAMNLLTRQGWLRDPLEYYAVVPVSFAYLATALVAARMAGPALAERHATRVSARGLRRPDTRAAMPGRRPALALATAVIVAAGTLPGLAVMPRAPQAARPPAAPARALVEAIPPGVPIYIPAGLYASLATRHNVGCWESLGPLGRTPAMRGRFDYIVLWPHATVANAATAANAVTAANAATGATAAAGEDPGDAAFADSLASDARFRRLGGYAPFVVYHRTLIKE